jgi:hypothetical protein
MKVYLASRWHIFPIGGSPDRCRSNRAASFNAILTAPLQAVLLLLAAVLFAAPSRADVWLSASERLPIREMFVAGASWDTAASHIRVLKLSTQYLQHSAEPELSTVIQGLHRRNIALAMEGLLLVESARCGRGVESYGGAGAIFAVAERVKRLGGAIDFVAMDEPIWFGSRSLGARTCRDTLPEVAAQLARNVGILRAAFPAVQFGDIEPLNGQTEGLISDIINFATLFHAATGAPLTFIHADLIWQAPNWQGQLARWRKLVSGAGMSFGVICDGDPHDATDRAWADHAVSRYHLITAHGALPPDTIVFQTWMQHPTKLLPDNEPDTLTNIVVRALGGF